ncbi:MAG: transporter substrate-binding domain-containing protein [Thermodesulfobacteriota bacterium]|nr:transporter substrate-binding domain-containing protein [Thermodesulfobacteriota bacterium]
MKQILIVPLLFFFCFAGHGMANESIVFAIDPTKAPMQFVASNGEVVGFEIDFLYEMGRQADFTPVLKQVPWQGIFKGLGSGEYDAVFASVSITDQRKETMDFTIPYYTIAQAVLILADQDFKKWSDLKGKNVGVKNKTTSLQTTRNLQGVNIVVFNSVPNAIESLHEKQVDAVICDGPIAGHYAMVEKNDLKIAFVLKPKNAEFYGIAVKKGNNALKNTLNKAISSVQNNNTDIILQKKWFSGLLKTR